METTAKASQQYKVMPIMISLLLAGFIGMFSETALNIALTDLMKELNITAATVQWLTTGYLLVLGILVPVSGLLLQWFTTRQLFTVSLIFSILGTFIAALAPSFPFLLAARIVQALGTGLLLPLMFNTILVIFPPHKRGAAMGTIGLVIMFAPAIGPTFQDWFWSISTGTGFSGSLFRSLCWRLFSVSHICRMYLKRQSRKSIYCLSSCRRLASAALCSDSATRVKALGDGQPDCYRVADCRRCWPYPIFNPPADNEAADDEPPCVQIPDVYFGCGHGVHLHDGHSVIYAASADVPARRLSPDSICIWSCSLVRRYFKWIYVPCYRPFIRQIRAEMACHYGCDCHCCSLVLLKCHNHINGCADYHPAHLLDDRDFYDHDACADKWFKPIAARVLSRRHRHYEYTAANGGRYRNSGCGQHYGCRPA